jgi:hypothetical protein
MDNYFTKHIKGRFKKTSQKMRVPLLILILLVVGVSVSCTSLPDVGPFVDATYQLKSAVAESGKTVASELRYINDGGAEWGDELAENWKARNRAFTAMAAYADSLQAIIASGQGGTQAFQDRRLRLLSQQILSNSSLRTSTKRGLQNPSKMLWSRRILLWSKPLD